MRAIIVFDSKHGNTERIADAIGKGLRDSGVSLESIIWANRACEDDFHEFDLWVIGSPTRWGGSSRPPSPSRPSPRGRPLRSLEGARPRFSS